MHSIQRPDSINRRELLALAAASAAGLALPAPPALASEPRPTLPASTAAPPAPEPASVTQVTRVDDELPLQGFAGQCSCGKPHRSWAR